VTGAPLFEARSLSKRYGAGTSSEVGALDDVSLAVPRGAFAVVTGPSGGGKTTLLSCLGALERPSGGHVLFDGVDLRALSESERSRTRRRIGFVFQASPMVRGLPLWENVTYPLVPLGVATHARRERARALLSLVGLAGRVDERPESLSVGELQRVGIARALVLDPEAVLADEPTASLDRRNADAVAGLLRDANRRGATVVVVTHDPAVASGATAAFELESGRLR
jgi:ABC-type lipoprotein export system ATPase subunit